MGKFYDLTGKQFGRWTVISYIPGTKIKPSKWLCRCSCGKEAKVPSDRLRSGRSQSCGCLHYETVSKVLTKHGCTNERLYKLWTSMRNRCGNKNEKCYHNYGGRGIKICEEWNDYSNFRDWAVNNGYDENADFGKCTIDRIDVNGDYSPNNCRFISLKQQENNRTNNRLLTFNGETKTMAEWAKETGINYGTISTRINRHRWTVEDALTIKPIRGGSHRKSDGDGN